MSIFTRILRMLDISEVSLAKKPKTEKPSLLKEVMDSPEKFKLEAVIEGDEILVKIKRKES